MAYCVKKASSVLNAKTDDPDMLDWRFHLRHAGGGSSRRRTCAAVRARCCLMRKGDRDTGVSILEDIRESKKGERGRRGRLVYAATKILGEPGPGRLPAAGPGDRRVQGLQGVPAAGSADTHYQLGRAYEAAGDAANAIREYDAVTAFDGHPATGDAKDARRLGKYARVEPAGGVPGPFSASGRGLG